MFNARTTYNDSQTEEVLDKVYDLFVDPELSSDADMGFDLYYTYLQASDSFTLSGTQRYAKPIANPPVFEAIDEIAALSWSATIDTMANLVANPQPLGTTR